MLRFEEQLEGAAQRLAQSLSRASDLSSEVKSSPAARPEAREALLFNLERSAWAMIEMASAWVYELRLGIPRKEAENFDLLQRHGWLDLESARRLKQLSEFRNLSARESSRIDWQYLGGDLSSELGLFQQWLDTVSGWTSQPGELP